MRAILIALASVILMGCASSPRVPAPVRADPVDDKSADIDPSLLEGCGSLPKLKTAKDDDNLEFTASLIQYGVKCSLKHKSLADVVRKALNVKAPAP